MGLNLISHLDDLLLHVIDLAIQLCYVVLVLLTHGCISVAALLQYKVLLLDVLELFGLSFMSEGGVLPAVVLDF